MPRLAEVIDDPTPMTAARIDVSARIGWLLRACRNAAGLSLRQMSAELLARDVALSATTLSRIETEGLRSPAALDGYAAVLDLPEGALRSPVESLCRTFSYAPTGAPDAMPTSLDRFSESYEAVSERVPTGGAWLTFARLHASEGGFGLPRSLMEPHLRRLADEVGRSVGAARMARYEALAVLRCSTYGDVLEPVIREIVLDPDTQLVYDLISAVSERPTPELLAWFGALLRHESVFLARGASYGLQNMLVVGGLGVSEWRTLLPHFVHAWHDDGAHPIRRKVLAQLCAALPPPLQAELRRTCGVRREAPRGPRVWSRSRSNVHYQFARSIADEACSRLDHHEEPLLARLLFEAMFDPRGARMVSSTFLIASSPFCGVVVPLLLEARDAGPDEATRLAAMRVASSCHLGGYLPIVEPWLRSEDWAEFDFALGTFGRSGKPLPGAALERGLSGDETTVNRTLYAAGMAADPRLAGIARSTRMARAVRRAAHWWAERDGRILD